MIMTIMLIKDPCQMIMTIMLIILIDPCHYQLTFPLQWVSNYLCTHALVHEHVSVFVCM